MVFAEPTAYLVLNDEELQEVACDMGALPMLQSQLKKSLKVDEDMYPSQEQIASAGSLREVSQILTDDRSS